MNRLTGQSVLELAEKIRKAEVTPAELLEAYSKRIDDLDDHIVAWEVVDRESAFNCAAKLTEEAKNGKIRSVLHGIPVGVKDIIDVVGIPTRHNCEAFREAGPAEKDADIVGRLKELGAVIVGKTHTAELAYFDPSPTRNPYNINHTPGGSSSGSAAAVAAEMVPFSVGTQTNASVARPAAYNGVGGYRPTIQQLPLDGVLSFSKSFDSLGFFGKTFEDAALGYLTLNQDFQVSEVNRPLKIGVVRDPLYNEATESVKEIMTKIEKNLKDSGHMLEDAPSPVPFSLMIETHTIMMAYEAAQEHKELVKDHEEQLGKRFSKLIKEGEQILKADYDKLVTIMNETREKLRPYFAEYDLLLAPPTDSAAPRDLSITGNPAFTTPWTFLGCPLAVIPADLDREGMPIGMMFISAPNDDVNLINYCSELERHIARIPDPIL